jgi:hypothetical protein
MNDIIACPSCQRKVSIPVEFFGKQVQCPECRQTFLAQDPSADAYQPGAPAPRAETAAPRPAQDAWDDADVGAPRRSRRRFGDDYYDDDDVGLRRPTMPHRGGAVLTLGILSLVICGPICGPIAWIMGHTDLQQIRSGYMDRSGEGITQAGMILGMIGTILSAFGLALWCLIAMASTARF